MAISEKAAGLLKTAVSGVVKTGGDNVASQPAESAAKVAGDQLALGENVGTALKRIQEQRPASFASPEDFQRYNDELVDLIKKGQDDMALPKQALDEAKAERLKFSQGIEAPVKSARETVKQTKRAGEQAIGKAEGNLQSANDDLFHVTRPGYREARRLESQASSADSIASSYQAQTYRPVYRNGKTEMQYDGSKAALAATYRSRAASLRSEAARMDALRGAPADIAKAQGQVDAVVASLKKAQDDLAESLVAPQAKLDGEIAKYERQMGPYNTRVADRQEVFGAGQKPLDAVYRHFKAQEEAVGPLQRMKWYFENDFFRTKNDWRAKAQEVGAYPDKPLPVSAMDTIHLS